MFQCCFLNTDEHALTQLSFSTWYQCWNNIGSSTLNQRNSINVVSKFFCQRRNNVNKHTSAQLSFATKYQRSNNVDELWRSTLFQRWFNVDLFAGKSHLIIHHILNLKILWIFTKNLLQNQWLILLLHQTIFLR